MKVTPKLTLSLDKTSVVAGGWDDTRRAYEYLEKETGVWKKRDQTPDPHIATLTATVADDGQSLAGRSVTFKWDMPGPAPEETRTVLTDDKGEAHVDVVSGDELSKDVDEDSGQTLFDNPVEVKVAYADKEQTKSLDVLAPIIVWQYKKEDGSYADWDGKTEGLWENSDQQEVFLRAVLTFNGVPVIGHPISWSISEIKDKSGAIVLLSDSSYGTYGHFSGSISTTDKNGYATASFIRGYNIGQLTFSIEEDAVYTQDASDSVTSQSAIAKATMPASALSTNNDQVASAGAPPTSRTKKKQTLRQAKSNVYTRVKGHATYANWDAYPAPAGDEDNELLPQTLNLARTVTPGVESLDNIRFSLMPSPANKWWISQVIGADDASASTHYANMKWTDSKGNVQLYGAAFDIVLERVLVFDKQTDAQGKFINAARPEFESSVRALRQGGFVAWHRWAGEYNSSSSYTASNPASTENEIHCIEPAMTTTVVQLDAAGEAIAPPSSASYLTRQVYGFTKGWANVSQSSGYLIDFDVTIGEVNAVKDRIGKRSTILATRPGLTFGTYGPN